MTDWFAARVRVARPTDQLDKVVAFYRDGLGLTEITRFGSDEGYAGVILGMPDIHYQLEFTQHAEGSPCPAPTEDNLLCFYIKEEDRLQEIAARLAAMGYHPVPPENAYWEDLGLTIPDPDGWRIVLVRLDQVVGA